MRVCLVMVVLVTAGCGALPRASKPPLVAAKPQTFALLANPATHLLETRYELREYLDAHDPSVRHEPHAVYRATRVPRRPDGATAALPTVPRSTFAPASYTPLPVQAELSAELATQQQITRELRAIQTAMTATQRDAESKFGELVNQTAETIKLRQALEEERARVRQLEASLREQTAATPPTPAMRTADMKW